jgi:phenylalanyl-tRNA synthetase beta chain
MRLGIRTVAATLNEKAVDPELARMATLRAIELYQKVCKATLASKIYDIYPKPYKEKTLLVKKEKIDALLGSAIEKKEIVIILKNLGFGVVWKGNVLMVKVPSFRANDMEIPEDIVEEIARIYGYQNLPSVFMKIGLPQKLADSPFDFEEKVRQLLAGWGGIEIYTISMVSKNMVEGKKALKIKNPMGKEGEYLRTALIPSMVSAARENKGEQNPYHMFEIANVYLKKQASLPEEKMILAGIFANYTYEKAKGIIEALMIKLQIEAEFQAHDSINLAKGKAGIIKSENKILGKFGFVSQSLLAYEIDLGIMRSLAQPFSKFKPLAKYPAQVEDMTFIVPEDVYIGPLTREIKKTDKLIIDVSLINIFNDAYTFRISYQHREKTLTNKEVEKVREKIIAKISSKFGASVKN